MIGHNFSNGHLNFYWYDANHIEEFLRLPFWNFNLIDKEMYTPIGLHIKYIDKIGVNKDIGHIDYFKTKVPTKIMIDKIINDLHNTRTITKNIFKYE